MCHLYADEHVMLIPQQEHGLTFKRVAFLGAAVASWWHSTAL